MRNAAPLTHREKYAPKTNFMTIYLSLSYYHVYFLSSNFHILIKIMHAFFSFLVELCLFLSDFVACYGQIYYSFLLTLNRLRQYITAAAYNYGNARAYTASLYNPFVIYMIGQGGNYHFFKKFFPPPNTAHISDNGA